MAVRPRPTANAIYPPVPRCEKCHGVFPGPACTQNKTIKAGGRKRHEKSCFGLRRPQIPAHGQDKLLSPLAAAVILIGRQQSTPLPALTEPVYRADVNHENYHAMSSVEKVSRYAVAASCAAAAAVFTGIDKHRQCKTVNFCAHLPWPHRTIAFSNSL